MGILHANRTTLDPQNAVGGVAELEDVAGQALDGEVLVDGADHLVFGLQHHLIVGVVGDRAAGGKRGEPRAAPAAQHAVDRVMMDKPAAAAAPGTEALSQHRHHGREILALERAIRPRPAYQGVEIVLGPFAPGDLRNDLLRDHIEGLCGDRQLIELASSHAVEQRRTFDELVAGEREQSAPGHAIDRVPRAPDTLQETGDRARRANLADQVDLADVDPELERSSRHQRLQGAALETLLRVKTLFPGETAVVRGYQVLAQALGKLSGHPLCQPTGIDEDQRRAMALDQPGQLVIDLLPDLARHHGFERRVGKCEREVAFPAVAGVDDRAFVVRRVASDQETCDSFDRLLGGRQPHPLQAIATECGQALERQRQVGAALVRRQGMDLVDDHGASGREHSAAGLGAEQDVERLRCGDDNMRRLAVHALALARRRIAGAHPGPNLDVRPPLLRARHHGCRRAVPPGCAGCHSTAPSAARHRRPASRLRAAPPALVEPGRRSLPERRQVSCPIPWAQRSAYVAPPEWPTTPATEPPWAQQSSDRTRQRPPAGTGRLDLRERS